MGKEYGFPMPNDSFWFSVSERKIGIKADLWGHGRTSAGKVRKVMGMS